MASEEVIRVRGYTQVVKGLKDVDKATRKAVRDELRHAGDDVKQGAAARFAAYGAAKHNGPGELAGYAKTAAGYRTYVRQRGVSVEQSLRKTTGLKPKFGSLQMVKALVPSLDANRDNTYRAINTAMDEIADTFNALDTTA